MIFIYVCVYLPKIPVGKTLDVGLAGERAYANFKDGAKILFKKVMTLCIAMAMLVSFS